ncbi:hypothetical protein [Haladaptatus sp. NG-WS-4]
MKKKGPLDGEKNDSNAVQEFLLESIKEDIQSRKQDIQNTHEQGIKLIEIIVAVSTLSLSLLTFAFKEGNIYQVDGVKGIKSYYTLTSILLLLFAVSFLLLSLRATNLSAIDYRDFLPIPPDIDGQDYHRIIMKSYNKNYMYVNSKASKIRISFTFGLIISTLGFVFLILAIGSALSVYSGFLIKFQIGIIPTILIFSAYLVKKYFDNVEWAEILYLDDIYNEMTELHFFGRKIIGEYPNEIAGKKNPDLVVYSRPGKTHRIFVDNLDGGEHQLEVKDIRGNCIDRTKTMTEKWEKDTIEIPPDRVPYRYFCRKHEGSEGGYLRR